MKTLIILFIIFAAAKATKFPHNFKLCNQTQPAEELRQCIRDAASYNMHLLVHPFKELGLPSLKPLLIPSLTIGSGKTAVAVEQHFNNCHIYGFDQVKMNKFDFDTEKKILVVDAVFPDITKKCRYHLNGRVLLLPIYGQGDSTIVLRNMTIIGNLNYKEVKRNGKTYLHFDAHNLKFDVGHVYFHFSDLFNGDENLGNSLNKVLNDNWKVVFDDVRDNYGQVINTILEDLTNKFWSRISFEEAMDPTKRQF